MLEDTGYPGRHKFADSSVDRHREFPPDRKAALPGWAPPFMSTEFLTSLSPASNFAVMSSVLTLRLPAIDPRFFYPNPSRPLVRRDSHKGLRSSPSCHMTNGRHRRARPQAR